MKLTVKRLLSCILRVLTRKRQRRQSDKKLFADGYQGGLHSTLVTRVRSSFKNLKNGRFSEFISVPRQLSIDQVNKSNMFEFMASGNRSDRRKNLVGLFQHVLLWIAYIDEIKDDPLEKDYFNFLFPYFSQKG